MTDDLISWLRACLDEDEQEAEIAHTLDCPAHLLGLTDAELYEPADPQRCMCPVRRLLAEVQAKRAILNEYTEAVPFYEANRSATAGELHGLLAAIKHLATAYADHPGYQEQWKP